MNQKTRNTHTLVWASLFALVSASFIALFYADAFQRFDETIYALVASFQGPTLTLIMKTATHMGGSEVLVPLGVCFIIALFLRGFRIEALIVLMTLLIGDLLSDAAKDVFARARPVGLNLVELPDTFSFPSGHSMVGPALYGMLVVFFARLFPTSTLLVYVRLTIILLVSLICLSRVYLGVHYASDVLAGLSMSAVWYFVVRYTYDRAVQRLRPQDVPTRSIPFRDIT